MNDVKLFMAGVIVMAIALVSVEITRRIRRHMVVRFGSEIEAFTKPLHPIIRVVRYRHLSSGSLTPVEEREVEYRPTHPAVELEPPMEAKKGDVVFILVPFKDSRSVPIFRDKLIKTVHPYNRIFV